MRNTLFLATAAFSLAAAACSKNDADTADANVDMNADMNADMAPPTDRDGARTAEASHTIAEDKFEIESAAGGGQCPNPA